MEKSKYKDGLMDAAVFLITAIAAVAGSYLYKNTIYETVRLVILVMLMAGTMIFVIKYSRIKEDLLFDNRENFVRFLILYTAFLLGSILFPLLPTSGWPFLAAYVGLAFFSNRMIGICGGSTLLLLTVLLGKTYTMEVFILYFVCGVAGILLFSTINEQFKVGIPLLISLLMQFLCLCLKDVLMVNEKLHVEMFLVPAVNVLVCLILLLVILKFFSVSIIYRNKDRYMDINDPECPLLVELKNYSREEYYHAIHTAYLCDRIAKRLGADADVARAGGYYHKIGLLKGQNTWENASLVLTEAQFPEQVHVILKEYLDKEERITSKETVILLISDTVISSISYLFSKDASAQLDYEKLVQAVFKKNDESGLIKYSRITLGELEEMKKILAEEKLYYDFLR